MDYLKKIGYIKGLIAGLDFEASTPERKVLLAVVDALEEMSSAMHDMNDTIDELEGDLESVSDDIDGITEDVEEIEEGVAEIARLFGDILESGGKTPIKLFGEDDDDDDEEDEDFSYAVTCPKCGKEFVLTEDKLEEGGTECPFCKEKLEFEIHFCDDDECDCGHHHDDEEED